MYQFFGKIEAGKLTIRNRGKVLKDLEEMKDGTVRVEIKYANKRTLPQNSYVHGVLIPEFRKALTNVGYRITSDEQAKEVMKQMFLTVPIESDQGGKPVHYVKHTGDLTKEEMTDLIDSVIQFCAENLDYQIPYPNEQLRFDV